jgi:hypothetical protein
MKHAIYIQKYKMNLPVQSLNNKDEFPKNKIKLRELHKCISTIENSIAKNPSTEAEGRPSSPEKWRFGLRDIDDKLPWRGLCIGPHEVQPKDYRDTEAAMAFTLALISRLTLSTPEAASYLLWRSTTEATREFGRPYSPGGAWLERSVRRLPSTPERQAFPPGG